MNVKLCINIYKYQDEQGRYYLHEHPQTAASWQLEAMKGLAATPHAITVVSNLCQFNLRTTYAEGSVVLAKKPTQFLTHSPMIAQ